MWIPYQSIFTFHVASLYLSLLIVLAILSGYDEDSDSTKHSFVYYVRYMLMRLLDFVTSFCHSHLKLSIYEIKKCITEVAFSGITFISNPMKILPGGHMELNSPI